MNQYDLQSSREGADPESDDQMLPEEEPTPLERFAMVFSAPREAFANLLGSQRLGGIIGLGIVFTLIVAIFGTVANTSNPEIMRKQMDKQREKVEQRHDKGEISDKQYEETIKYFDQQPSGNRFLLFGLVGALIVAPLMVLILGAIFFAVARVLQTDQDTRLTYKTGVAALCLAGIISGVATILQFIGLYVTGNPDFAIDATFFAKPDNPVLASVMHSLTNPFVLWWMAVCGIGIAAIAKTSWGKATVVWALVWTCGAAFFAYIGSLVGFGA